MRIILPRFTRRFSICESLIWSSASLALAILATAAPCGAEIIKLRNGNTIEGLIQERRDGKIYILTSHGELAIREDQIDESYTPPPEEAGLSGIRIYLDSGQLLTAIARLDALLEEHAIGGENQPSRADLLRLLVSRHENIKGALLRLDPVQGDRILARLADLAESAEEPTLLPPSDQAYRVALADWQRTLGHAAAALESLKGVEGPLRDPFDFLNPKAVTILVETISKQLGRFEYERMKEALDLLEQLDPEVHSAISTWAWMQVAGRYRDSGEFREALKIYRESVYPYYPHLARNRVLMTLESADAALTVTGSYETLVSLYEEFGLPLVGDRIYRRLEEALEKAGRAALDRGDSEKASQLFVRLQAVESGNADKLLLLAEAQRRRAELEPDDAIGHFELSRWALQQGLYDTARSLLEVAAEKPEMSEVVRRQHEIVDRTQALKLVELATQAFEGGRYLESLDHTEIFLQRFQLSPMRKQMRELKQAALVELQNEQNQRPLRADSLFQQAERLFFLGKFNESLHLLDQVVLDYGETPAADRARSLKSRVLNRMYGTALEGRLPTAGPPGAVQEYLDSLRDLPTAMQADSLGESELRNEILELSRILRRYRPILEQSL